MTEGPLGAVLLRDMKLLRGKLLPQLRLWHCHLAGGALLDFVGFFHCWNTFGLIAFIGQEI
jgi:hypothetical protein